MRPDKPPRCLPLLVLSATRHGTHRHGQGTVTAGKRLTERGTIVLINRPHFSKTPEPLSSTSKLWDSLRTSFDGFSNLPGQP